MFCRNHTISQKKRRLLPASREFIRLMHWIAMSMKNAYTQLNLWMSIINLHTKCIKHVEMRSTQSSRDGRKMSEQTLWLQLTLIIVTEPYSPPFRRHCVRMYDNEKGYDCIRRRVYIFFVHMQCNWWASQKE